MRYNPVTCIYNPFFYNIVINIYFLDFDFINSLHSGIHLFKIKTELRRFKENFQKDFMGH